MAYVIAFLFGFLGGALCLFIAFDQWRRRLAAQSREQSLAAEHNRAQQAAIDERQSALAEAQSRFATERAAFDARFVSFQELQDENAILKRDLRNLDIGRRKLDLDRRLLDERQVQLDKKIEDLGARHLKDTVKWIGSTLTPNNFANCKQRLLDVIGRCRDAGLSVSHEEEQDLLADLKRNFELVVRAAFEREEQARIRAQIREEARREKEIERELQQAERERQAIQAALDQALAQAHDRHSEEVERLQALLAEAEAKSQRALSQAQLTKSGHIYVISNIGSFGEGVFKVGMTRRLDPNDRVRELGDASVPFPFDVHMMISCDDAPTLENALHKALHHNRVNKANPRKEFFRADIENIRQIIVKNHGEVQYVADAEALQYRQSLTMTDEDEEFIEGVYDDVEDEEEPVSED